MTVLARLKDRPRATTTYTIAFDPAAAEQLTRARVDIDNKDGAARAAAKKQYLRLLADTVTVTFTLSAIGPARWEQLMAEHPPTPEQIDRAEASATAAGEQPGTVTVQWNEDTFPPALLAESVTSVAFSDAPDTAENLPLADAVELWAGLSQGDRLGLFTAAQTLNLRPSRVDLLGKD